GFCKQCLLNCGRTCYSERRFPLSEDCRKCILSRKRHHVLRHIVFQAVEEFRCLYTCFIVEFHSLIVIVVDICSCLPQQAVKICVQKVKHVHASIIESDCISVLINLAVTVCILC